MKIKLNHQVNKKGSSTIFLMMVLSSMILLTMAYIQATIRVSGESTGQSVALLSARSVMTEFDRNLKKDYGLFAFRGEPGQLAAKMDYYLMPFFENNPYYNLGNTRINSSEYRFSIPTVFEDEVTEYMLYAATKDVIGLITENDWYESREDPTIPMFPVGRVLRNHQIIESLPSYSLGETPNLLVSVKEGFSDWKHVFQNTSRNFLVNQYIMMNFKNAQQDIPGRKTFFNYEAEYILKGNYDDQINKTLLRRDLLLLRNFVNLGILYANPELWQQVVTAASILTPGPEALATQLVLAELWALAESENDVRILEHGKRIPIQKTLATWAIDLQSVIEGSETGYIDTKSTSGLDYQGYLQIFLFFENRAVKLTRVMDLIQINIQGNYDSTFLINEHQMGFAYDTEINYFKIHGATEY